MTGSTTPTDFLTDLARALERDGTPFDPRDLAAWLASAWPRVQEEPSASRWARAYREALGAADVFCP
jgi:hypothetical protein